jgi:hypothetical protein
MLESWRILQPIRANNHQRNITYEDFFLIAESIYKVLLCSSDFVYL